MFSACFQTIVYKENFTCLAHWGRVTHICVSKLIIGSANGLSPGRRQAIIWTNAGIMLIIRTLGNKLKWNLNRNSYIFIQENAFESVVWKTAAILSQPRCVKAQCTSIMANEAVSGLGISNWIDLSIRQVGCRTHVSECIIYSTLYLSKIIEMQIKPNQLTIKFYVLH